MGGLWFLISKNVYIAWIEPNENTWYKEFELEKYSIFDQLTISVYFALSMLSTVGIGDMHPLSNLERIVSILCMISGMILFSIYIVILLRN